MRRSFKYKLKTNKAFQESCERTLNGCRELYNAALSQRISAHRLGKSIGLMEQSRQLTEARRDLPEVGALSCAFQQNTLRRLDKAFQAFFRRAKSKRGKAGFPRFKSYDRYDSFNTRDSRGFKVTGDKLTVSKLGSCRLRLSRPPTGRPVGLIIRRECSGWFVVIICDNVPSRLLSASGNAVGIDVGLTDFVTLSTGEAIRNPRWFRASAAALASAQQRLALKRRGSESRKRAKRLAAKAYSKVRHQRDWFHWQEARRLVARFDTIAIEKLSIKGLAQGNLAKSVHDAAWASFINKLLAKAEEAGRTVVKVSARFTSQECSGCGKRQKKDLADRWHQCDCGVSLSRDHNAALNILGRAAPDLKIKLAHAGG